jgi:putative drug exporter of the RND superfamily
MAKFLHKLGTYLYRHKWLGLTVWIAILVGLGGAAATFALPTSSSISIPGTPAQTAIDRLGELFPGAGKGSGRVVFYTPNGVVGDYKNDIATGLDKISKVDGVAGVISPFDYSAAISSDSKTAYAQIQMKSGSGEISDKTLSDIASIADGMRRDNLQVERGGDLVSAAPSDILGPTEAIGLGIAVLVLVVTFGALIAAGMPVLVAVISVGASMAGLFSLSRVVEISSTTPALAVMLGLAVGIDYSLFIMSKYRSLLLQGYSKEDAVGRAIGTAGNAVIFAATTVVIALSALSVVQIPFMTVMGLAGAATVAVAALVSITMMPVIFSIFGDRLFGRKTHKKIVEAQKKGPVEAHEIEHDTIWHKLGKAITKHPIIVIASTLIIVGIIASPIRNLTLGLPGDQYSSTSKTERRAYDLLTNAFGAGFNAPLTILVENVPAVTDADRAAVHAQLMTEYEKQVAAATAEQTAQFQKEAVAATTPAQLAVLQQKIATAEAAGEIQKKAGLEKVETLTAQYSKLYQLNKIATEIAKVDGVKSATPATVTDDGAKGIIQVIPTTAPSDKTTVDLIAYLRGNSTKASGNSSVSLAVTGSTALQEDINKKLADALPLYLGVVVGLSLILLMVAFRSILVPIKATIGFLLSVGAMFGAIVAVFQWGWFGLADPAPIVSFIPIISIGILFGLAMDYEFFLVSSMHETYSKSGDAKQAIITGFGHGAKVVTAAAAIMVAVFAGFIGNGDTTIQSMGLGLAVGIFVDAFIVRMVFVPAVMTLLGKCAWWLPKWLDRIVPHVSIEGEEEE